jgi:hypothetical protein
MMPLPACFGNYESCYYKCQHECSYSLSCFGKQYVRGSSSARGRGELGFIAGTTPIREEGKLSPLTTYNQTVEEKK